MRFLAVQVPFDDTNARNLGTCSSVPADGGIYALDKGSRLARIETADGNLSVRMQGKEKT